LSSSGFFSLWLTPEINSLTGSLIQKNNQRLLEYYENHISKQVDLQDYRPVPCRHFVHEATDSGFDIHRANQSCTLSFVLPGFMKAGTTYLYGTIDNHPWVVHALRGFDYKEAGCYAPDSMFNKTLRHLRMDCYPFLEEKLDYVKYGDGSIIYAPRKDTVYHIVRDNPNVKVLFSVRDPIERAESIHRFDYPTLNRLGMGNINECIHQVLSMKVIQTWYHMAWNATNTAFPDVRLKHESWEKLSDKVMGDLPRFVNHMADKLRCMRVVHDSLYFPQIYYWARAVPATNIRVLNVQKLQTYKLTTEEKRFALETTPVINKFDIRDLFQSYPERQSRHRRLSEDIKNSTFDQAYVLYQFNALFQ
jgi:hypothetical protein